MSRNLRLTGEKCPDCGFRTHKAEFDGETRFRCVTDGCSQGWFATQE